LIARASATGSGIAVPEVAAILADIALASGDTTTALACVEPVIAATREDGPPSFAALAFRVHGAAQRIEGKLDEAEAALAEAAERAASLGNEWMLALTEYERARVAYARGETGRAEELLHDALARQMRHDLRPDITATLDALGTLALDAESTIEGVRCFAAADALRAAMHLAPRPIDEAERAPRIASARDVLGAEMFDKHWNEATDLPLDEMVAYISRARGERKRPSSGWESLTPTEIRIVTLAAEGLTNPQIAERMFIARGTVKVHLSHVFAKLGVSTRSELAAQATKRELAGQ
jgi:ATP/maltotriose-dependent transcriptional regulator MalT